MTAEQFNEHGWKATDKVVYKGKIYDFIEVNIHYRVLLVSDDCNFFTFHASEIELYQPLHEAHTSLLTNPD